MVRCAEQWSTGHRFCISYHELPLSDRTLLNFVEPSVFHDPEAFSKVRSCLRTEPCAVHQHAHEGPCSLCVQEYGSLTDSSQLESLHSVLAPYLLR